MSTDHGSIRVVGGDTDTIDVRIDVSDGLLSTDRDVRIDGRTLVLDAECPWLAQWWCSTDFTLRVPRSTAVVVRGDPTTVSVTGVDGDRRPRRISAERLAADPTAPGVIPTSKTPVGAIGSRASLRTVDAMCITATPIATPTR